MIRTTISIDGRRYDVEIKRAVQASLSAPRLVIAGFQPNALATALLRLCIESMRRFTSVPCELWVVDNCSPASNSNWLAGESGINVVFNRTRPREPLGWAEWLRGKSNAPHAASYANGIALALGAASIDQGTQCMVTLHQDTMACHPQWLQHLLGKFSPSCRSAGVLLDTRRVPALHVLGMAFDFQLFRSLKLNFRHDLPNMDVGDGVSIGFARAGYHLGACRNTHVDPTLIERLRSDSPFRSLHVARTLDDDDEVIFMHLGRGTLKALGRLAPGKTSVEEWIAFGRRLIDEGPAETPSNSKLAQ